MPQDKMTEVLYDIELIQALSRTKNQEYSSNEAKDALMQGVLEKHNITKEVLDSSLVWYSDNIELFKKVKDSISSRLEVQNTMYSKLLEQESRRNGTMGNIPYYYNLTPDDYIFRFNFDSIKIKALTLTPQSHLSFNVLGLSSKIQARLSLYMQYSDTTIVNNKHIDTDSCNILLGYLKDRKLMSFSGYIKIDSVKVSDYSVLLYNLTLNNDSVKKKTEIKNRKLDEKLTFQSVTKE